MFLAANLFYRETFYLLKVAFSSEPPASDNSSNPAPYLSVAFICLPPGDHLSLSAVPVTPDFWRMLMVRGQGQIWREPRHPDAALQVWSSRWGQAHSLYNLRPPLFLIGGCVFVMLPRGCVFLLLTCAHRAPAYLCLELCWIQGHFSGTAIWAKFVLL